MGKWSLFGLSYFEVFLACADFRKSEHFRIQCNQGNKWKHESQILLTKREGVEGRDKLRAKRSL